MKAKELMLFDLIRRKKDGKSMTVVELRYAETIAAITPDDVYYGDMEDYHESEIEPIPLTPEILEKNGFEKLDFSHFQIGGRRLVLDADGRWDGPLSWHWVVTEMSTNAKGQPVVLDYYVATITFIHELQHALRLCGIDKEIVL